MSAIPAPQPVNDIKDIDLDSHLVIEASAGTGKTHTIEELVVELLVQGRTSGLDRILVVTFTEKATAELKEKIRKKIEQRMDEAPSPVLRESLDNFDTASIYTIHGFCNRVLSTFAFENSEEFGGSLTGDIPVYEKALRRIILEQWPAMYGPGLTDILAVSGFPDPAGSSRSGKWLSSILEIVVKYQPMAGDALVPGPGDIRKELHRMEQELSGILENLSGLIGPVAENTEDSPFYRNFSELNIHSGSQGKNRRIIRKLLDLLRIYRESGISLPQYLEFLTIDKEGLPVPNLKWNKGGEAGMDTLPALMDVIDALEQLNALDLGRVQNMLATQTIVDVRRQAGIYKEEKGLISYDDMIERVCRAIDDDTLPLRQALQERYSHALVDEFQDTDMLQWNIFKKVFLQGKKNRLFIIGDPKQAIYGFRGADIQAYYTAKDEMLRRHRAKYYSLMYNWRSLPSLIGSFNSIFGKGDWFSGSDIDYVDNEYPDEKEQPDASCPEQSLVIADLGKRSGTEARLLMAEYIAEETAGLIRDPSGRYTPDRIAVLVRNWTEAGPVERAFAARGIPCSCYKRKGLYQSREAAHLFYILEAVEDPSDSMLLKKALLTDFFGLGAQELAGPGEIPMSHPAYMLISAWHDLALKRDWPGFFQSVREDSGMLYRAAERENAEQSISAYTQILQDCESEAIRENLYLDGIIEHLYRLRNSTGEGIEGENIFRTGSEDARVQIMTIHNSKGLQFRVVFLAGGYTSSRTNAYWTYHKNGVRTFDLCMKKDDKSLHEQEQEGEERRLFYVALTRAEELLYVPRFVPNRKGTGIIGSALSRALESVRDTDSVRTVFVSGKTSPSSPLEDNPGTGSTDILLPDPLFPVPASGLLSRKTGITSFSGIKSIRFGNARPGDTTLTYGEEMTPAPEYDEFSRDVPAADSKTDELPRGADTGTMLHEILENIVFADVLACKDCTDLLRPGNACLPVMDERIKARFPENENEHANYREQVARILWNTLHSPLDEQGFCLGMVTNMVKEMEFHFPAPRPEAGAHGITVFNGFIHGFIDLVFRHGGRYYLLDWKSNYIEQGYSRKAIEEGINAMHYDLQYSIYTLALFRWLRSTLPDFSPEIHFGGIYYIYLRGMDVKQPGNGVFFIRPDRDEIERYETDLSYSTQTIAL